MSERIEYHGEPLEQGEPIVFDMAWNLPLRYQDVLDYGIGDEKLRAWAREEQAKADAESERYWRSLPLRVRAWRRFRGWQSRHAERVQTWLHDRLFPDCPGDDRW